MSSSSTEGSDTAVYSGGAKIFSLCSFVLHREY
jgi:hypothetical protein